VEPEDFSEVITTRPTGVRKKPTYSGQLSTKKADARFFAQSAYELSASQLELQHKILNPHPERKSPIKQGSFF